MDRALTYTVADLALDEGLALRCDCRVRILGRAELAALVGRDARLHLIRPAAGNVVPRLRRAAVPRLGRGGSPQPIAGLFAAVEEALTRTTALLCQVAALQRLPPQQPQDRRVVHQVAPP